MMSPDSFFGLKRSFAIVAFAIAAACLSIPRSAEAASFDLSVLLSGALEVPPVISPGSGSLVGTYDDVTNELDFLLSFSGLLSPTNAAHFHAPAPPGVNAPVIISFVPGFPLGVTSGNYANTFTLTVGQETQLLSDLMYVNIHTDMFPGGEIRGQLTPTAAVPEPGSLLLLGAGVAGLTARHRRALRQTRHVERHSHDG